jgi:predicted signal transduction protein with EAL and GGDEF domain
VVRSVNDYRFVWKDKIFNVGVSIGLVEIGRDSGTIEDIINSADSACYVAKKQGGLHVHVYSAREEANARHSGEIQWLLKLQGALRDNKFELYYQPIVHARAGGLCGRALSFDAARRSMGGASGAVRARARGLEVAAGPQRGDQHCRPDPGRCRISGIRGRLFRSYGRESWRYLL